MRRVVRERWRAWMEADRRWGGERIWGCGLVSVSGEWRVEVSQKKKRSKKIYMYICDGLERRGYGGMSFVVGRGNFVR